MSSPREPDGKPVPAGPGFSLPAAEVQFAPGSSAGPDTPIALALGMFDGVHRGHQAVLASAAEDRGSTVAVFTFRPHPSRLLRPEKATQMLFSDRSKAERLFHHGVGLIIWKAFDLDFSRMSASGFVQMLLEHIPSLRSVHVGENFRFGHDRLGTPALLAEGFSKAGVKVCAVPRTAWRGDAVSSTRVRTALRQGEIADVNTMLGEVYTCQGEITGGKRLGRSIGFPTLNLAYDPECRPRFGVYLVRVRGAGGEGIPAIANYGLRPTVEQSLEPRLEVHVLQTPPPSWDTGYSLRVDWLEFLRPEERFGDVETLKNQIDRDVAKARTWFSNHG